MAIVGKTVESIALAFTTSASAQANFKTATAGLIRACVLATDADVYINFDAAADDTNFILQPGVPLHIHDIQFTTLAVKGVNDAGTMYVLAMR
jgi:hypothetical protein